MVQLLIRLGKWLEQRFPKKLLVTEAAFKALDRGIAQTHSEISMVRGDLKTVELGLAAVVDRVSSIEASAVHKGAVQDLVILVKQINDDVKSLKASLGFQRTPAANGEMLAMLNGEII